MHTDHGDDIDFDGTSHRHNDNHNNRSGPGPGDPGIVGSDRLARVALRDLVEMLSRATSELLESIDAPLPSSIEAAFSLLGDTHAVVTYGEREKAHVVVGDHPRSTTSAEQPWMDIRYGRRDNYFPIVYFLLVEIAWLGLQDDASYVVADYIGIDDFPDMENLAQQVIASSSFTAIPKPYWTQYVTFTAFDVTGG